MPSSLIFAGLVVLWLLILVPAVARRRQEVARLSPAVLSGRVLERPMRHRLPEVDMTERRDDGGATTVGELADRRDDVPPREVPAARTAPDVDDDHRGRWSGTPDEAADPDGDGYDDEPDWEPPVARYRPGRGGFDPEAAAATAHAKYAFRQRLVLALLVLLLAGGALALLVSTTFWWATAAVGLVLASYLTYLRRQVRIEESIRSRRTARLAGTRRAATADDPEADEWARRGRDAAGDDAAPAGRWSGGEDTAVEDDEDEDWTADDGEPSRIRGTGVPVGVLPARCRTVDGPESTEHESSLPRVEMAPMPAIPAGTSLVDVDDEEQLDAALSRQERPRAAGE